MKQRQINIEEIVLRKNNVDKTYDQDTLVKQGDAITCTDITATGNVTGYGIQNGGVLISQFAVTGDTDAIAINTTGQTVSVDSYFTTLLTGDYTIVTGETATLADGSYIGQVKLFKMTVDGGDNKVITVNSTNTLTFANAGETAKLIWDGSNWIVLYLSRDAGDNGAPIWA